MTEDVRLLVEDSVARLHKQIEAFPPGFPADRNGIRLGIAAIQDETSEVLAEWYDAKRTDKDWTRVYDELLDVIAVAMYTALDIRRWKK